MKVRLTDTENSKSAGDLSISPRTVLTVLKLLLLTCTSCSNTVSFVGHSITEKPMKMYDEASALFCWAEGENSTLKYL